MAIVSFVAWMLIGGAAGFLAAFLRDLRFFLAFFLVALFLVAFFLAFFLATFFLAFLLVAFFLAFFLVAFFLAPTLRFFATRFLATRFFAVFFFAAFFFVDRFFVAAARLRGADFFLVAVRLFADLLREDFFFAPALDFLRVALANAHLLKAYAFAVKRLNRDAL